MKILCLDTTMGYCSAAIINDGDVIYHKHTEISSQSEEIFNVINAVLEKTGIKITDIRQIICTVGPGSFTGVRIGIAATRGIKIVYPEIAINGVTNTQLLAFQSSASDTNVFLNAYRGQVYYQKFLNNSPTNEIKLINVTDQTDFNNSIADESLREFLGDKISCYRQINAQILAEYLLRSKYWNLTECMPVYVRPPDAIPPKRMFDL